MTMTDNKPAWRDDILACYPYLLERLRGIDAVYQVCEAQDFAAISGKDRRQIPTDGAVYVLLDGFTPTDANARGAEQDIEIGFSVILTKQQVTPNPAADSVGKTLTAISKALQGFDPVDEQGRALTVSSFKQAKALAIQYEYGFAFFPLRFTTTVAVVQD